MYTFSFYASFFFKSSKVKEISRVLPQTLEVFASAKRRVEAPKILQCQDWYKQANDKIRSGKGLLGWDSPVSKGHLVETIL